MYKPRTKKTIAGISIVIFIAAAWHFMSPEEQIDFSTQVKPILNSKCISCHGGVKAKAGFSVLFQEEAFANTESGKPAIVPGNSDASELIRRIRNNDPEERMPYKHEPLSSAEINILERWIDQGAKWGDHWAYLPIKPVAVPQPANGVAVNDIDRFILDRLAQQKLTQSPQAAKEILLRRVSLDLIGTLPEPRLAQWYLQNNSAAAYEQLVDSLLASPQYGERWASMWLDIARYADTKGYEADVARNIWRYRDWVINAFNEDLPYDEFITQQIAGDLLPDPTDAHYIATGFHRNSMTNDEGGTDNEEFRVSAVIDRVNTTWEGLMGTTFACVQCHSHPYDPFRHDEYYKFMAFFNNTRDEDVPGDYPLLRHFEKDKKKEIKELAEWVRSNSNEEEARKVELFIKTLQPAYYSPSADSLYNAAIEGNNSVLLLRTRAGARFRKVNLDKSNRLIYHYTSGTAGGLMRLHLDSANGAVFAEINVPHTKGWVREIADFPTQRGIHDVYVEYVNNTRPKKPEEFRIAIDWFAFTSQLPDAPGSPQKEKVFKQLVGEYVEGSPIMLENDPGMRRVTQVFERGNWREKTKAVAPAVPSVLEYAMPEDAPANRRGLAMWLTDKRHPLVSRTLVNRLWEQLFGTGIVETLEDMGTQGFAPTHKELLDHLSLRLMNEHKWSVKKMLKEMVMSHTYRQDSRLSDTVLEKDPNNILYARGPRIRLSAEQLRDQHLHISGMLSKKMYGTGVMPWQPDGIWLSPYNGSTWKTDTGENHYRRAIYTYWKRSSPYPSLISFDGVQRNVCSARRIRTNTPLQALVTLNDSVYVDLARQFAKRMKREGGDSPEQQIAKGYELMLYKKIKPEKLKIFVDLYRKAGGDEQALNVVANAMLNIDEVITKN